MPAAGSGSPSVGAFTGSMDVISAQFIQCGSTAPMYTIEL